MTTRKAIVLAVVLSVLGLFVIPGGAGSIVLALGFVVLFGVGVRSISGDAPPREEPRLPAGHSGV
jgi:hypothetical protein